MSVKVFPSTQFVPERSTYQYQVGLLAPDKLPVNPTQIASIALALRDVTSGGIVNSRDHIDVLNVNGGVLSLGLFTFQFVSDDTAILGTGVEERRLLTLDVGLVGGGRATHEVSFYVRNLMDITS
jgi:hypothetical protein